MAFDFTATITALQTALVNTGYFTGQVFVGEPFAPPADEVTAAIFAMEWESSGTTLAATIDAFGLCVRVYARAGKTPADAQRVEIAVLNGMVLAEIALAGAFTLGGTIRAIDWAGEQEGRRVSAKWGHLDLGGTIFRMVDITLPLIIDDIATFAA